jgi:hypothetical protein
MEMQRFNLKKLNEGEVEVQYQVAITNKFPAVENLKDNGDINRAWNTIRENIKISVKGSFGCCELKHHKPWFDEECSKLVDEGK